ncbi:hypothetical protein E4Q23_10780 [Candidatus Accumulibacter phosphatis]|jgi:hypothetical protein|uniref:DNA-binding protein n=1 Tax=Candidatus Accumulibacter phosphatis TaxID=327160 RepID=A0ABX1TYQ5_9PROT|nr:hypothetical protein [Candidatus Accumulibacter phosphatis]NMQ28194.1 hypothetical protein [Candidatus Accumulibacter phosphatis]
MTKTQSVSSNRLTEKLSTEELANRLRNRPQTARAAYCRDGHYLGMVPAKLPSGRLLWDAAEVEALLTGEAVQANPAAIKEHLARKAANPARLPEHIARKVAAKRLRVPTATVQAVTSSEVA